MLLIYSIYNITIPFSSFLQIQLHFNKFALKVPNDCESNFVDIFPEATDLQSRLKNFCGSIADLVQSPENVLKIRFLALSNARDSNFEALFTAFREKPKSTSSEPISKFILYLLIVLVLI